MLPEGDKPNKRSRTIEIKAQSRKANLGGGAGGRTN